MEQLLNIGKVVKRSGVAASTLHYYETRGLIQSVRSPGNQRRYHRDVLRRVALIKVAQNLGVSLSEIEQAFKQLPEGRIAKQRDWQNLAKVWQLQLDQRISQLTQLRGQLSHCIGCGCLSVEDCPLRNPADQLATKGSGAQLLDGGMSVTS
ncbi:redox-sensitive transcriptional activator SoxR [Celerinatantimonas yamalensis]|uniref:Redox-sensitive transcriptional activator SoxR n=1 Tax=Celerinatantimonas yamalensis TaxID=559956 RepID=A0ABW9G708_9GAMM